MSNRIPLENKLVGETRAYTFDFTSKMTVGSTISTQSVAASVYSGVDASPSSIVTGSASASGTVVTQKITAGTSGVMYELLCTITTSDSLTLSLVGILAVVPDLT